ncbi:uncharacterized protein JN550_000998 [Neoarthrinium moseri]|uniref:uncharacterized protein n=1 Tax=Neoarthrinium moseri TaxID=1658444 RepID=UPI001FDE1873|nr:uncharacterized protein JN550_000998 [Neoarthrinium moseri]KAI1876926.1 hypothetical protein JN550_000998 [Neoarthrinium moseri]
MEILQCISRQSFSGPRQEAGPDHHIRIVSASASSGGQTTETTIELRTLFEKIETAQLFDTGTSRASLNLVYFPRDIWKLISEDRPRTTELTKYLRLDDSVLGYLISSRSGWYCVDNTNGLYTFMVKEYLYMLVWSFDTKTFETRGMVCERSEFESSSKLKDADGNFALPMLKEMHLYHPLSLACISIADLISHLDILLVKESHKIGDIEDATGHGFWIKKENAYLSQKARLGNAYGQPDARTHAQLLTRRERVTTRGELNVQANESLSSEKLAKLTDACQSIARSIGVFANVTKTIDMIEAMADSLKSRNYWDQWFDEEAPEICRDNYDACTKSFGRAVGLLEQRIRTIRHSGKSFDERARAQFSVISTLISRTNKDLADIARASKDLAEDAKKDTSDMKVIALMTMGFLPATFFAALFAIPSLDWDRPGVVTENFWIYWACTVPTTFLIFIIWDFGNGQQMHRQLFNKIAGLFTRKTGGTTGQASSETPTATAPQVILSLPK